ncbi:hypothetical protein, partial [Desulfobacula sp.]|uniref:hypothetical protein n=1 Tax=Desulfobacula sp. TaxID=2593537 RepID=UPI002632478A
VHGGCAAVNRGADFVQLLVPSLRARTRSWTGHRTPINQTIVCLIGARRRSAPRLNYMNQGLIPSHISTFKLIIYQKYFGSFWKNIFPSLNQIQVGLQ